MANMAKQVAKGVLDFLVRPWKLDRKYKKQLKGVPLFQMLWLVTAATLALFIPSLLVGSFMPLSFSLIALGSLVAACVAWGVGSFLMDKGRNHHTVIPQTTSITQPTSITRHPIKPLRGKNDISTYNATNYSTSSYRSSDNPGMLASKIPLDPKNSTITTSSPTNSSQQTTFQKQSSPASNNFLPLIIDDEEKSKKNPISVETTSSTAPTKAPIEVQKQGQAGYGTSTSAGAISQTTQSSEMPKELTKEINPFELAQKDQEEASQQYELDVKRCSELKKRSLQDNTNRFYDPTTVKHRLNSAMEQAIQGKQLMPRYQAILKLDEFLQKNPGAKQVKSTFDEAIVELIRRYPERVETFINTSSGKYIQKSDQYKEGEESNEAKFKKHMKNLKAIKDYLIGKHGHLETINNAWNSLKTISNKVLGKDETDRLYAGSAFTSTPSKAA